ncbi:FecR family protein [Flavivirga spongiicola]|uniref:DUF4974 domain-containing protein n=1 Tax=Flavivirga spongiicola TaxID=421621 RepID=A0ABU7XZN4_9FLAO|nr:FecR family protein [Flavivirga sp. MEBiC05379]MDO5981028.1 FecR family protein [Flavivirga sp. MEBiC05379]MDO5981463.1 FecR family protein [Flavivirga sp. MEBiC05379]
MESPGKTRSLSEKIAASLLMGEAPVDLEGLDGLTEEEKKRILFNITDRDKREERVGLINRLDKQKARNIILGRERQRYAKRKKAYLYGAMAASVALFLVMALLLDENGGPQKGTPAISANHIEAGTDRAILTLGDGSRVSLEKGRTYRSGNASSNGEEIEYRAGGRSTPPRETAYNTLSVPRGAEFQIRLSDGTRIWLNSETRLKYPVAFGEGETRQVELVHGEAYFDVSPSRLHGGAKFKVVHEFQDVEVLGTEFNIKAYKEEGNIYTTLVEGKVSVNQQDKKQLLAPNEQLNLNTQDKKMTMARVDTDKEVSWKEGVFSFRNKSLKDIMKTLSRWYDMEVVFENKVIENEMFMGSFNKGLSIEDVMTSIKNTNIINGYHIKEKTLTIK